MRELVFIWFVLVFVFALFTDIILALATLPSVLLSYWIWRDGKEIKVLREQLMPKRARTRALSKAEKEILEDVRQEEET